MAKIVGRRIVFPEKGVVKIEDFELEAPAPHQILVQTISTLISVGTELVGLHAKRLRGRRYPSYPGYANISQVLEVGAEVKDFSVGERVFSQATHATHCLLDVEKDIVLKVPEAVPSSHAAFTTLAAVALYGIREANISLGESVAIFGQGLVGALSLQFAKLAGAEPLIAIDLVDSKLALARQMGATHTINPKTEDLKEAINEATRGKGARVVIEAAGNPQTIPEVFKIAAQRGRIVVIGGLHGPISVDLFTEFQLKELTMLGRHQPRCPAEDTPRTPFTKVFNRELILHYLETGRLQVEKLISLEAPYSEAPEIYQRLSQPGSELVGVILNYG
jgi:2-desacetyl-2-hydroxyethyl bacteriochlorophyllide A dehydrogenase